MRELLYAMIKNSGYGTIIESASSTAQSVRCDRNFYSSQTYYLHEYRVRYTSASLV